MSACETCLARSALLDALSGEIEILRRERRYIRGVLALGDDDLRAAVGRRSQSSAPRSAQEIRRDAGVHGLQLLCRHDPEYPMRLRGDRAAPAVLYAAGAGERRRQLLDPQTPAVAIVGARSASVDGLELTRRIARGLATAGVTVISGMALGIDGAAHDGALAGGARTVAILAGGAETAYPRRRHGTHAELVQRAAVLSETPPGGRTLAWRFLARNRIIAALGDVTIVVEAAGRSGSLVTAEFALDLGREVGAVPGSPLSPRSIGTNALLVDGAALIRDAEDVLELLATTCGRPTLEIALGAARRHGEPVGAELAALLADIEAGIDQIDELAARHGGVAATQALATDLELRGLLRRTGDGRLVSGQIVARDGPRTPARRGAAESNI